MAELSKYTGKYKLIESVKETLKSNGNYLQDIADIKKVSFTTVVRWIKTNDSNLNDLAVLEKIQEIIDPNASYLDFLIPNPDYEAK